MLVCKQCGWSTLNKSDPDLGTYKGEVVHCVEERGEEGLYIVEPCGPVLEVEEAKHDR